MSELVILAASDGRAGNAAMAMGLAEAVAKRCGGRAERIDLHLPALLRRLPPVLAARLPTGLLLRGQARLAGRNAALVIGAGRRVAPVVAALCRRGMRTVQILDPQIAPDRFDFVVAPDHDRLRGERVLSTLGSVNRVTPALLEIARADWQSHFEPLARPRIAVLIGGATRRTPLAPERATALGYDLAALGAQSGGTLMVTASRRTGEANIAALRKALPGAFFWNGEAPNPYFGLLAWADAAIVSDDSVNMASEAATAGLPLAIYPLLEEGGKIARFHAALFARGLAAPFARRVPQAGGTGLDETGRIAALLVERFGLAR